MSDELEKLIAEGPEGYWVFVTSEVTDFSSENQGKIWFSNPRREKSAHESMTFVDLRIDSKHFETIHLDRVEIGKLQYACERMIEKAEIYEFHPKQRKT